MSNQMENDAHLLVVMKRCWAERVYCVVYETMRLHFSILHRTFSHASKWCQQFFPIVFNSKNYVFSEIYTQHKRNFRRKSGKWMDLPVSVMFAAFYFHSLSEQNYTMPVDTVGVLVYGSSHAVLSLLLLYSTGMHVFECWIHLNLCGGNDRSNQRYHIVD